MRKTPRGVIAGGSVVGLLLLAFLCPGHAQTASPEEFQHMYKSVQRLNPQTLRRIFDENKRLTDEWTRNLAEGQSRPPRRAQAARPGQRLPVLFPPDLQQRVTVALQALPPARRTAAMAQLRATPSALLEAEAQLVKAILPYLSPQDQQRFVNGLFEVSPAEAQFSQQVLQRVAELLAYQRQQRDRIAQTLSRTFGLGTQAATDLARERRRQEDEAIRSLGASR